MNFPVIFNTIILLGALQGFILSCLLFFSRRNRLRNKLLAWLMLLISLASIKLYAFATYTEVMVMEVLDGRAAAQKLLRGQVPENKEPIIGSYDANDFRLGDVYPKGCMMLHTLRNIIDNDSTWFNLLRGLQEHFRYQTVTTGNIVDYINKTLGKDLTSFFDQYLRHAVIPELQLKFKQNGDELEVEYRWKADVSGFNMPVKVTTTKNEFAFIYPESDWKTIALKGMKQKNFKVDTNAFLVQVSVQ